MYGEIYFHTYCIDNTGYDARLSIRKKNYTGSATFVDAGPVPFTKSILNNEEDLIGGIYPTMASIQLIGNNNFGMNDLMTANDSDFQIVHLINDVVDWIGFLSPEGFGELDTNNGRYLDINAFDGLTRLKNIKFLDDQGRNYGVSDGNFEKSFLFVIKECLKKTGLSLDFLSLIDRLPVSAGVMSSYNGSFSGAWLWSYNFNPISHDLIKVGNYITYNVEGFGTYTAEILEVDRSEIVNGGGTGIKLNPTPPSQGWISINFEAVFFSPVADTSKDVISIATHDVRLWVDPDADIERESKADKNKYYYEFTDGTYNAWDVLNSIAVTFDFRVSQENGRWILEALDIHRIQSDFFRYDANGVYMNRVTKLVVNSIPCKPIKTAYKLDGNTRYVDKTLKTVSVGYGYRRRVNGDPLTNKLSNGSFTLPPGSFPANIFTPLFWSRITLKKPIQFNIYRPIGNQYIEISSADTFNSYNMLQSDSIKVNKGDELVLGWQQSIEEGSDKFSLRYLTLTIKFIADTGETYYLVNHEDEDGWRDFYYMSGNQKGQWIQSETSIYHYNSNYSKNHYHGTGWGWSELSKVKVLTPGVASDGTVSISVVGVSSLSHRYLVGLSGDNALCYIGNYDRWLENGEIVYSEFIDSSPIGAVWHKGNGNPKARVTSFEVSVIASGSNGSGRLYEYTQDGDYFDKIDNITLPLGDETNVDHLSVINVNGKVNDKWVTRDASLQVAPIGLLVAKSIMRRYYKPKRMLDGGVGLFPSNLSGIMRMDDELILWKGKSLSISSKPHTLSGTFYQMLTEDIPRGGVDYGPNSIKRLSGSSSGSSMSAGSGGGITPSPITYDLQKTTENGNKTTLAMETRGTHNTHLLGIPTITPPAGEMKSDMAYISYSPTAAGGVDPEPGMDFYIKQAQDADLSNIQNGQLVYWDSTVGKFRGRNEQSLAAYATMSWVLTQGFATQSWVNNQGFLKSESDTLQSVTDRGNGTTNPITVPSMAINGANSQYKAISFAKDGILRWYLAASIDAENGGNTGSNFQLFRYKDNGDYLGLVMHVDRATGNVDFHERLSALGGNSNQWNTAYTHAGIQGNPHNTQFSQLLAKPTTLGGYGITDAMDLFSAQIISGRKTFTGGSSNAWNQTALEIQGNGTTSKYPGIAFHQPGIEARVLNMRHDAHMYLDDWRIYDTREFTVDVNATANTVVKRTEDGYIQALFFQDVNTSINNEPITAIYGGVGNGYLYKFSQSSVNQFLGMPAGGDTLQSVTNRGSFTTSFVKFGGLSNIVNGDGIEFFFDTSSNTGVIQAYGRGTSNAYQQLVIGASVLTLSSPLINASGKITCPVIEPTAFILPTAPPSNPEAGKWYLYITTN